MLKVGITGGIGSGKTTVCKIFETLDIPIYYADDRAKALMVEDQKLILQIKDLFGKDAYIKDGQLNRQLIASVVFQDKKKLQQLNQIVHPAVWEDGEKWNAEQAKKGAPYSLKEAALIYESGGHQFLDKVITVYAPQYLRIQRVRARDKITIAQVKSRIAKQMPDKEKMKLADFIIKNNQRKALIPQVMKIHWELLKRK